MGETTGISWTTHTFNGWWGCARVSRACRFCYAADLSKRFDGGDSLWGKHAPRRIMTENTWNNPARWNRAAKRAGVPAKVFASSMADVFEDHPQLPEQRERLWRIIEDTPWLIWQLLTKRPENIAAMVPWGDSWPQNVWIGASVESQRYATARIMPLLRLQSPVVRFLSVEPLVGALDLTSVTCGVGATVNALTGAITETASSFSISGSRAHPFDVAIDWVILGGESGPRPDRMDPQWARDIRDQCDATGAPLFMKQLGTKLAGEWGCTGKGHDPAEWPEYFPQSFPKTRQPELVAS